MTASELFIDAADSILQPWSEQITHPTPKRLDAVLKMQNLYPTVAALMDAHWGYLVAITGLDQGSNLEILYHFAAGPAVTTLRVNVSREAASVPSICHIIPSASLYERELIEMFGVTVKDTPDSNRLFLPDDWPSDVYPLRKDAKLSE